MAKFPYAVQTLVPGSETFSGKVEHMTEGFNNKAAAIQTLNQRRRDFPRWTHRLVERETFTFVQS